MYNNVRELNNIYKRGMIYWADHSGNKGCEQGEIRPVIIVQNDVGNKYSPTVIVMSITSRLAKPKLPTHFQIFKNDYLGLGSDSVVLGEQIRTMDKRRLGDFIGRLKEEDEQKLDDVLAISFDLLNNKKEQTIDEHLQDRINGLLSHIRMIDGYIVRSLDKGIETELMSEDFTERQSLICELKSICKNNSLQFSKYYDINDISTNINFLHGGTKSIIV